MTEQVSTLKRERFEPRFFTTAEDEGLGLENATLQWNEVKQKDDKGMAKKTVSTAPASGVAASVSMDNSDNIAERTIGEADERLNFELKDISVIFPAGKLTVVTGPTASGKSALLVSAVFILVPVYFRAHIRLDARWLSSEK